MSVRGKGLSKEEIRLAEAIDTETIGAPPSTFEGEIGGVRLQLIGDSQNLLRMLRGIINEIEKE